MLGWTNSDEEFVLQGDNGSLTAKGFIAKWSPDPQSPDQHPSVNTRDGDDPKRTYYTFRVEIIAGNHILSNYGLGEDRKQSYFAHRGNAIKTIKDIMEDLGLTPTKPGS